MNDWEIKQLRYFKVIYELSSISNNRNACLSSISNNRNACNE